MTAVIYLDDTMGQYLDYCDSLDDTTANATKTVVQTITLLLAGEGRETGITSAPVTSTSTNTSNSASGSRETGAAGPSTTSNSIIPSSTESASKVGVAGPVVGSIAGIVVIIIVALYIRRRKKRSAQASDSGPPDMLDKPQLHSDCVPRTKPTELDASEWREPSELAAPYREAVEVVPGLYEMEDRAGGLGEHVEGRSEIPQPSPVDINVQPKSYNKG